MKCANCPQNPPNKCYSQGFDCTGGKLNPIDYQVEENNLFLTMTDKMRSEHGNSKTRLEEIIEFSKNAGFTKLGIGFCIGLAQEAQTVADILSKSFILDSVCCKMGGIDKDEHDIVKINPDKFEVACNPIGQAKILNRSKTDLNIQMGLCLGHDILFQKYSDAPVTVLVVKDRVLANNPMGVVYGSYWRDKFGM